MDNIRELLGIKLKLGDFTLKPGDFLTPRNRKRLESAMAELDGITRQCSRLSEPVFVDPDETYQLFFRCARKGPKALHDAFSTAKQVFRLALILNYRPAYVGTTCVCDSKYFEVALELLDRRWKYRLLPPLFFLLLSRWRSLGADPRKRLTELLMLRLEAYRGKRTSLLRICHNKENYTGQHASHDLGKRYARDQIPLAQVWDVTNLPESTRRYEYWDDFLMGYCDGILTSPHCTSHLESLIAFLREREGFGGGQAHPATKYCLSQLLVRLHHSEPRGTPEILRQATYQLIGDPAYDHRWAPWDGATDSDKNYLGQARDLLNQSLSELFIQIFFDQVAMDPRRKKFWLQYYKKVPYLRIFCPDAERYRLLLKNSKLGPVIDARTAELSGSGGVSAFVMQFKDYLLVEFSKSPNAFYAYRRRNSPLCPEIDRPKLQLHQLKRPRDVEQITDETWSVLSQGKLFHNFEWEKTLERWLAKWVQI